jgi:hypothetical protein
MCASVSRRVNSAAGVNSGNAVQREFLAKLAPN